MVSIAPLVQVFRLGGRLVLHSCLSPANYQVSKAPQQVLTCYLFNPFGVVGCKVALGY
jgi:hypothetical protein